jgi:hypothetical protein
VSLAQRQTRAGVGYVSRVTADAAHFASFAYPAARMPDPTVPIPMPPGTDAPALPEWVGLKWMLGQLGRRVDVARLQGDPDYARVCLDEACRCGDPALRDYAGRLRQRL